MACSSSRFPISTGIGPVTEETRRLSSYASISTRASMSPRASLYDMCLENNFDYSRIHSTYDSISTVAVMFSSSGRPAMASYRCMCDSRLRKLTLELLTRLNQGIRDAGIEVSFLEERRT